MLDPARLDAALRRGPAAKPLIDSYREVDARRRALQGGAAAVTPADPQAGEVSRA